MKYFIATLLLLLVESICYADVQISSDEIKLMDAVSIAYSKGDKAQLKDLIERRLDNDKGDILGLALRVSYFSLFDPQSEEFRLSIDALYQRTDEVQSMRQAVDEYLRPANAILKNISSENYDEKSLIDGFPFHEDVAKDPIFLMFFRSAEGLSMVYESRLKDGQIEDYEQPLNYHRSHDQQLTNSDHPQDIEIPPSSPEKVEAPEVTEEAAAPKQAIEEPAEVVIAQPIEKNVEPSSNWWLWIIGAVVIVGGLGLVLRRKS
jgi:hypothetical protein